MEGDSRADGRTAEARRYGGTWRWTLDVIVTIVLLISCLHSWFGSSSGVPSQQQLRLCVSQPQLRRLERRALVAMEPGPVRIVAIPQRSAPYPEQTSQIADATQQTAAQQAAWSEAQQQQQQQQPAPTVDDVTMGANQDQQQQQLQPARNPTTRDHQGPPLGIYVSSALNLGSSTWANSPTARNHDSRVVYREHVCHECRANWVTFYPPGGFAPQGWHAGNQREIWPTVRRSYGECSYCHVVWRFEALQTPAPAALVWSPVSAATPAPLPSRVTLQTPTRSRPWSLPCRLEE